MRIIAGQFRGRVLKAPKGEGTRPTTDRVRESVMSVLASARGGFEDAVVLDAFAGSGALGIEALSRGAARAAFYERDPQAARVVEGNVALVGLDARQARVVRADVLERPPAYARPAFDLVFLDPPYALAPADALGLARRLRDAGVVASGALVSYEHASSATPSVEEATAACGFALVQRKKYGDTVVDTLRVD